MKKILIIICTILASTQVQAQIKEKAIDVSIGLGLSAPYDGYDIMGTGFYAQGEYVLSLNNWVDLRPYAGVILTKVREEDIDQYRPELRSIANAFLFGGKARFTVPIPWIAPYVELGIGGSVGSFETYTLDTTLEDNGFLVHIPFSLGLELGPRHNVNIEFTYYYHKSVQQYAGAAAFGLTFPIGND
ncbi:outer membrane beta-barrel protein [Salinimicrobium terrae]|uniref:outer membrane beta-barrel protein n=1 Tax=Salinimicrobium terrae TaxID=470866 RepID=UPI000415350E|nr:outer membrane beta-barrel protein [Salinimicrobium terrae]